MPMLETVAVALIAAGAGAWLFFRYRAVMRGDKSCGGGCANCRHRAAHGHAAADKKDF